MILACAAFFSLKFWPAAHDLIKHLLLNHSGMCSSDVSFLIGGENDSRETFKRSTSVDII